MKKLNLRDRQQRNRSTRSDKTTKVYMRSITLVLVLWLSNIHCVELNAQVRLSRSVLGSGAATAASSKGTLRSTVGQSAIGRTVSTTLKHNAGFWYTTQSAIAAKDFAALVVVPNMHAAPGESFQLPLLLQQSKNLIQSGAKSFTATLRFNATLMEPIQKSGYTRINDTGWVSITGVVRDTLSILATTDFLAKLGSQESTPVVIESFSFLETAQVSLLRKDGVFSLDGVCRENGEIRLIRNVKPTALQMFPNPASTHAQVRAFLSEDGETDIQLIDERGISVATVYAADAHSGALTIQLDLLSIPSGSYFLLMRTPNEVFSQKCIIQK